MKSELLLKIEEILDDECTYTICDEYEDCFVITAPDMGDSYTGSYIPFYKMEADERLEDELGLEEVDSYKPFMKKYNLSCDRYSDIIIYKK